MGLQRRSTNEQQQHQQQALVAGGSSPRRSTPHSVAPTISHLRGSMLGTSSTSPGSNENLLSLPFVDAGSRSSSNRISFGSFQSYGSVERDELFMNEHHSEMGNGHDKNGDGDDYHISFEGNDNPSRQPILARKFLSIEKAASQIPAIALVTLFHLMVGIPFGVSYFPVGWKSSSSSSPTSDYESSPSAEEGDSFLLNGPFPLPGKESLGIRMFLFSTIIGQIIMTYASNFENCIALQMVENVPFCQSLSYIVVKTQGYGKEALSTLFFLFGLASVIVGGVFYALGRMQLGRILYFFPAHGERICDVFCVSFIDDDEDDSDDKVGDDVGVLQCIEYIFGK
mmetsp:Transcript_19249/g.39735  ORF Transcript_19249/g.39735 Transcript_19249/m.39735 type:complete len:340 (-) Transcript_19249:2384-3403(-)